MSQKVVVEMGEMNFCEIGEDSVMCLGCSFPFPLCILCRKKSTLLLSMMKSSKQFKLFLTQRNVQSNSIYCIGRIVGSRQI